VIVEQIQHALREAQISAWLFFDHHQRDPVAYRILHLSQQTVATRRWYYLVPATGEPTKLVHKIESASLDTLPGKKTSYSSWTDQREKVGEMLQGHTLVAMQYSPNCSIPYISLVDAGTVDLIRSFGVTVVSSADLVQEFESCWTTEQISTHFEAGKLVDQIRRSAFDLIGAKLSSGQSLTEYEVQQFIRSQFSSCGLITDHGPIVAVNANASDPHYEPNRDRTSVIRPNDVVLIDLWAKLNVLHAVYYDITWVGYCGTSVPDRVQNVFQAVKTARESASNFVIENASRGEKFRGYQVDDIARQSIVRHNLGEYFFHRTGHSIGEETHGTGANMDNLESHDDRLVIPGTCFSIEPGVYLPEFGIRSEVNVLMGRDSACVTGEQQDKLILI
jgi:Xaa-Pro dipeptidase